MEEEVQSFTAKLPNESLSDVTKINCDDVLEMSEEFTKVLTGDENSDVDDEILFPSKSKKIRNCALSDSDDDLVQSKEKTVSETHLSDKSDNENPSAKEKQKTKKSRINVAWISGEENENSVDYQIDDLSSNSSHRRTEDTISDCSSKLSVKKNYKKKKICSDDENSGESVTTERSTNPTWLLEEENDQVVDDEEISGKKPSSTLKEKGTPKDGMRKIHSESQRMVRESSVCLPYHKPKQRSLLEFLNRKRVTPSSEDKIKPRPRDASPAVMQVLEERAKEIEDFFKSESEESENELDTATEKPLQTNVPESKGAEKLQSQTQENINTEPLLKTMLKSEIPLSLSSSMTLPPENTLFARQREEIANDWDQNDPIAEDINENKLDHQPPIQSSSLADTKKESVPSLLMESDDSMQGYSSVFTNKDKLDNIKRLSIAKVNKPILHGKPGQLLDLDVEPISTEEKAKVNHLIERFVEQVTNTKKSPQKRDVQISIVQKVMNAEGQLELKRETVNVIVDKSSEGLCASAGRRQLIKDSLRQSMSAKRAVDRLKKQNKVEKDDISSDKASSDLEEDILSDEPETDFEDDEEDEDIDFMKQKKKKIKPKNIFVNDEAEDSGDEEIEDSEDEEDFGDSNETNMSSRKVTSQQSDKEDILETDATTHQQASSQNFLTNQNFSRNPTEKMNKKMSGRFSSLEDLTPNLNMSDSSQEGLISNLKTSQNTENAEEELLALCSGKFPDTTPTSDALKLSQDVCDDQEDFDDEAKPFSRIVPIVDDDQDSSNEPTDSNLKLVMELVDEPENTPIFSDDEGGKSNLKRKKKRRICLSDDEDDSQSRVASDNDEDEMHEEEREFRGLTDFFEDEAELSGSEVGSGDEREDEEDHWEEEEGDKEDIDENEVREQVGRAHMKTLLDQDQREVRLFQELFLEDGDLHSEGGGRQRQFRWKNADGDDIEEETMRPNDQEDEIDTGADDQDDLTWRKMRSEREKWLQQQKSQQGVDADVPLVMKRNGKTVKVNTNAKLTTNQPEKVDISGPSIPLLPTSPKENKSITTVRRGSFLRRSAKDLSMLASLTKSVLPVQAPKAGSNFVFASITPERPALPEEKRKFKQEGSVGESSNQNPAPAKKAKVSLTAKSIFSYF